MDYKKAMVLPAQPPELRYDKMIVSVARVGGEKEVMIEIHETRGPLAEHYVHLSRDEAKYLLGFLGLLFKEER